MSCRQLLSGPNGRVQAVQTSFLGYIPVRSLGAVVGFNKPSRRAPLIPCLKCQKKDDEEYVEVTIEDYPYSSYYDASSGQWEPASGARASIPGPELWPEGTANRVRAARAPAPTGKSEGSPSFGKRPGSRRKKYKPSAAASESEASETSVADSDSPEPPELSLDVAESSGTDVAALEVSETSVKSSEQAGNEFSGDVAVEEPKDILEEYVVYQEEAEAELTGYDLDKKLGRPHPFIDPRVRKPIENKRPDDELWWHKRKPEKAIWSRWQRRRPDVETVFLKAMAETGEIKLFGETPTVTEATLYRARKHVFKAERVKAEKDRLRKIGPLAYYSEWVKAWTRDTSREAVQKHFEETGEDESAQLLEMFSYQTDREYRTMYGTDVRVPRDPLAMRMREDLVKQIWGGDPVYPTVNYIQDPNAVIDYRSENYHEPMPKMLDYLKEHGFVITREDLEKLLGEEKKPRTDEPQATRNEDILANAIDIGEKDFVDSDSDSDSDEDSDSDTEVVSEGGAKVESKEEDEKLTDGWSILKSTPELRKSKGKAKEPKKEKMSIHEAMEDAENLTDFLLDFDEEA